MWWRRIPDADIRQPAAGKSTQNTARRAAARMRTRRQSGAFIHSVTLSFVHGSFIVCLVRCFAVFSVGRGRVTHAQAGARPHIRGHTREHAHTGLD